MVVVHLLSDFRLEVLNLDFNRVANLSLVYLIFEPFLECHARLSCPRQSLSTVVYVSEDQPTRMEILRVNHDDPWQGGHFGRARTQEVI